MTEKTEQVRSAGRMQKLHAPTQIVLIYDEPVAQASAWGGRCCEALDGM